MRRFILALTLALALSACKLPDVSLPVFTDYPKPSFLADHGTKTRSAKQGTLNQEDIAFLDWIQKPGAKDYYIWNESKARIIPQAELDFLDWIITPGAKEYFISQHIVLGSDIVLSNGIIEVHLHGKWGGSIVHVSESGKNNLVNNYDLGRQIQQSYYAGDNQTYKDQHKSWSPWPWNPIQSGDVYDNPAKMTVTRKSKTSATIRTVPMFWDRNNVPATCATMTSTVSLNKNIVHVRARLTTTKSCTIINPVPRHQEMPAVYTIGTLNRLMTYIGDAPCTGKPLTEITKKKTDFIWDYWPSVEYPGKTTEKWAAAVGRDDKGLGVYMKDTELFIGGKFSGMFGTSSSPKSSSTTYFSPLRTINLKPGDSVSYDYYLIVGSLDQIRKFACER